MSKHKPLVAVLLAYLVIGALFILRVPAWQAPDEPAHYNYAASLVRGVWPVIESSDWDSKLVPIAPDARDVPFEKITYQDHQPPLFYALGAPVYLLTGGSLTALRAWTLLIGAVGIVACYGVVLILFPGRTALAGAAAVVYALLPQHVHIMASYNNDALSEALLALTVLQSVRMMRTAPNRRDVLLLALTAGAAMWTKAQAYLVLPIGVLALVISMTPSSARTAPRKCSSPRSKRASACPDNTSRCPAPRGMGKRSSTRRASLRSSARSTPLIRTRPSPDRKSSRSISRRSSIKRA
jgi:4-amino-4-deoxy-L-arabinose transferase-like glycosyltransferase